MKQEIRQKGKTILYSEDNKSIPMIFNNLTGSSFDSKDKYNQYIKYVAIHEMGFEYGEIEFFEDNIIQKVGLITKL